MRKILSLPTILQQLLCQNCRRKKLCTERNFVGSSK